MEKFYKFKPIFKQKMWGGDRIPPFKNMQSPIERIGESWEISCVPGSESIVEGGIDDGKSLSQIIFDYGPALVGTANYRQYGTMFPLLIKFIDACLDLSVQVHPDDAVAMKRHGCMGKTEMWYVIDNNKGRARLCSGLSKEITPDEYTRLVDSGRFTEVLDIHDVAPGDVFFLPPGRVHSIGSGCLLAEIQQTSDITYRIYDYNRLDADGRPRELHTSLAKEVINFSVGNDHATHYIPQKDTPVSIADSPYFKTKIHDLTRDAVFDLTDRDQFVILICTRGECFLDIDGATAGLTRGHTILIPAAAQTVKITTEGVKILETYV